jgi:uncharacterized membrane protein YjjP (DUF1212 family)
MIANKVVGILARHATTAAGAIASVEGVNAGDWRVTAIGAVVSIAGMYFSYLEKRTR